MKRPADLEGAGFLQVFGCEPHVLCASSPGEKVRSFEIGSVKKGRDDLARVRYHALLAGLVGALVRGY